jgi:hypothetical protein
MSTYKSAARAATLAWLVTMPLVTISVAQSKPSGDEQPGWTALFDGKSLDTWIVHGGKAEYRIEGDMIVGRTVDSEDRGTQTFLCTRREYSDFELQLDVWSDKELNSGIQIRSHVYEKDTPTPKRPRHKGEVYGYQCEIANSERCTSGNFQDEARGYKWYDDLTKRSGACAAFKDNQWNHYRIVAQGDRMRSWVNGVPCADFRDTQDASGLIGLQVHTVRPGLGPFQVRFKNIRIRELKSGETIK